MEFNLWAIAIQVAVSSRAWFQLLELVQEGIYRRFVDSREQTIEWKLA